MLLFLTLYRKLEFAAQNVCRFEVVLNPFGKAHSGWLVYKHHPIPEHRLWLGRHWQPRDAAAAAVAAACFVDTPSQQDTR
jgi:hypothetical protein